MSDNPFAPPAAAGGGFTPADHNGRLLLIEPLSVEEGIQTDYGMTDAIRADVAVIDGDDAPLEFPDTLLFPKVLQGQLRRQIGKKVLGRLGQGEAKKGQSPPWKLAEATSDDIEVGKRWLAHIEKRDAERAANGAAVMKAAAEATSSSGAVSTPF